MWYIYYDWGISGFFGLLSFYSFSLTHSPTPKPKKKQPQKPETGQNDGIYSKKTLIKSYL